MEPYDEAADEDGEEATPTEDTETPEDDDQKESEEQPTENVIYAFAPDRISIIEPEQAEVVAEITADFGEEDWGDILPSPDNRRLFINRAKASQVLVIDTGAQEIETQLDVGPDPTHMYHPRESEIWTHADENGTFYVVDIENLDVVDRVVAALNESGHRKLAYHDELGDAGYATNTKDSGVHVVDLKAKESTDFIETHDGVAPTPSDTTP